MTGSASRYGAPAVVAACLALWVHSVAVPSGQSPRAPLAPLPRMRAVHMEGNWGGNIRGIRTAVSSFIDGAQPLTAASVQIDVGRSSFVNASGATVTNDIARVSLAT